jgi:hypothetical protein
LIPSIDLPSAYYNITTESGDLTIYTAGVETQTVNAYFTGRTVGYNGQEQDLLEVSGSIPTYYIYQATNNLKTNAGNYTINITVTTDNNHHFVEGNNNGQLITSVNATINKAAVTVTANDVNVYYGAEAEVPNFSTTGTVYSGDQLNIDYEITANDEPFEAFEPTAQTVVGNYPIVVSASNSNYNITLVDGVYHVNKANAQVELNLANVYYNRDLSVSASARVNTIQNLPVTITYYTDSEYQNKFNGTPTDAGIYYVKATVAETYNYNAAQATGNFTIYTVKLADVEFTYNKGNVTWTEVTKDSGRTDNSEPAVQAKDLKAGTTVTYFVYNGNELVGTYDSRTFDAAAATTYTVVAHADNANYVDSTTDMLPAYSVAFAEGTHNGTMTSALPATQYVFKNQTATAPADPTGEGCTFARWELNEVTYTFTEQVTGNITLTAKWADKTYTVVLKYLASSETEGEDMFTITGLLFGETVDYSALDVEPTKSSDNAGIYYTFANKWQAADETKYDAVNNVISGYTVEDSDDAIVFVAVFDINYNSFTITYHMSEDDGTVNYTPYGNVQNVNYGDVIDYKDLPTDDVAWFTVDGWYTDLSRTAHAPATMPAANLNVYAGYKFDIGAGDVNADGTVTAADITLYRRWIVGGYEMIPVVSGEEWATVTSEDFDEGNVYYLARVADINVDAYKDIRDVSITRMAVVGGYNWDIVNAYKVSGNAIIRTGNAYSDVAIISALNTYGRAKMSNDINMGTNVLAINSDGNVYLDLGGHTLNASAVEIITTGYNATITVKNGTILAENSITLRAPNGNVIIENVDAYVANEAINLQAASSSLHFIGDVGFYTGSEVVENPTPAPVKIAEVLIIELKETLMSEIY